jgi:integrase
MAKDLTQIALDKLKSGPARREVPDGKMRGLFHIIQPTGARSWAVRYRINGISKKLTLGPYPAIDLKEAREKAADAIKVVVNGEDPAAIKQERKRAELVPDDRDLVEKVAAEFVVRYAKPKQRSWAETERILNKEVVAPWMGRRLSKIGRADVHELLDGVVDRGAPIMANRCLAALRRMGAWAVERGLIESSRCDKVKAPAAERSRDRVLSDDELKAVWKAADAIRWPFGPMLQLLVLTGQRRDEIASMSWNEIDFEARTWTLPRERSKNDQAHVVPLSEQAIAILKDVPKIASKAGYVFTTNGRAPVSGFARAKARLDAALTADMEPWVIHDLRRTFASGAARLGIAINVVEKCLNHSSGTFSGIVSVYQKHDFADEKRIAMQTWARHVAAVVAGTTAANIVPIRA